MARKEITVTRDMRYGTRMLKAGDRVEVDGPRARLLTALGWGEEKRRAKRPQLDHDQNGKEGGSKSPVDGDMKALRAEYRKVVGKQPFNGWDAATLREKIEAARK